MKLLNYLIGIAAALTLLSCEKPEESSTQNYQTLDSIANTLWYSVNTKSQIYYDIRYAETTGVMDSYTNSLRTELIESRDFTYTFTPATEKIDALVSVTFENGQLYSGILIPKGVYQVNDEDVYWIQLYEVDDKGYIIYDENNKIKSSILMWME
jgi:hypothetical protein